MTSTAVPVNMRCYITMVSPSSLSCVIGVSIMLTIIIIIVYSQPLYLVQYQLSLRVMCPPTVVCLPTREYLLRGIHKCGLTSALLNDIHGYSLYG